MIRQLRPFYSAEELPAIYDHVYDHTRWEDHKIRVATTIHIARWMRDHIGAKSGADFSAGDGAILRGCGLESATFGDFVRYPDPGDEVWVLSNIDNDNWWNAIHTELYICSETLEHVQDPRRLLGNIRKSASALVLSTPEGEEGTENPEHYWGWDRHDIRGMLESAGWEPVVCTILDTAVPGGYTYQIWGCV
jgi:hypothetical protein